MKKLVLFFAAAAFITLTMSFTDTNENKKSTVPAKAVYEVPADVQEIIDNSCYGCHNSDSKNKKGKLKLDFDKMPEMKTGKLVGKLVKIHDAVDENDMPPKKFLNNYPDRALTDEQKEKLTTWAKDLANANGGE